MARIQKVEQSFLAAAGLSNILSDKFIGSALQEVAGNYESIKKHNFDHFNNLAEEAIDECRAKLRDIAGGSVVVRAKTIQGYGVKGVENARSDVKIIHIGEMSFWVSDFGRKYFELNKAAIKRGVQITRIFALAPEEVKNSINILKEQEKAGVRVLIIKPNKVDHEFAIFDERILIDFKVEHKEDYRTERITVEATQVKRAREEFKELVTRYGKSIKDSLSTV